MTSVFTWSWPPLVSNMTHSQIKLDHSMYMCARVCLCVLCVLPTLCCHRGLIKVQSESTEKPEHAITYRASTGHERCLRFTANGERGSSVTLAERTWPPSTSGPVSVVSVRSVWWKSLALTSPWWKSHDRCDWTCFPDMTSHRWLQSRMLNYSLKRYHKLTNSPAT